MTPLIHPLTHSAFQATRFASAALLSDCSSALSGLYSRFLASSFHAALSSGVGGLSLYNLMICADDSEDALTHSSTRSRCCCSARSRRRRPSSSRADICSRGTERPRSGSCSSTRSRCCCSARSRCRCPSSRAEGTERPRSGSCGAEGQSQEQEVREVWGDGPHPQIRDGEISPACAAMPAPHART